MPIKQSSQPRPAGAAPTVYILRRDHEDDAGEVADRHEEENAGRNNRGSSPCDTAAAATPRSCGSSTSNATRPGIPGKVAAIEYDPNRQPPGAHPLRGRREAYILAPPASSGSGRASGPAAEIKLGNALRFEYASRARLSTTSR